ncbi:MAG TPA: GNAT family N-acetyltransferase [Candidatus Hydrogenedentes bacterium]|nr:GNAT family N-acetyltransferase [Candidatus Hydrogenedentota bacterium]
MINRTSTDYEIKIFRTREEILAAADLFQPFQRHPNADIELYLSRFDDPPGCARPCAIAVLHEGQAAGVLLGISHPLPFELGMGFKTLLRPKVRMLNIPPGGIQGAETHEAAEALMGTILTLLRQREVDVVRLFDIDEDSPVAVAAGHQPPFYCRDHTPWSSQHFGLVMPESMDIFYNRLKRKHRNPLQKAVQLLNQEEPGELTYRVFTRPEEVAAFAEQAEAIARHTYQRRLGASFEDSPASRRWLGVLAERGLWRGYVLSVQNQPCAYWLGWRYGDLFYLYSAGRDPSVQDFNPGTGTILLAKLLEDVCEHTDVKEVDFGPGDYPCKRRFCDTARPTVTRLIFAPTPRGITVNAVRTTLSAVEKSASALLAKLGLRDRVKRHLRNRLTQDGAQESD